ncbi:outer membrane protein assembly factor BamE [Glaciecola sp. XM2]|jgi:outer membrane protein assembly factor BamE|uniref:outer membrane protein assembly factor BamE n=1 Tax=Glaciecola sp. XM2 TaxID=1914931 RepID=UPI001BDF56AC|nr:outer membrane protein assembly factor BamE [Glaciecola sp. XM2]MBT1450981.1 outer membrane protein assembly factor BamE [Glaciecola sp. XM2]
MKFLVTVVLSLTLLTGCSDWIFRIDVPQGNFLEQKDVSKLRVEMTKEQVVFVLGNPVVQDSFDTDTWYYYYEMKRGMSKRGPDIKQTLILNFEDGKLASMSGDFEEPEEFNVPLA